MSKLRIPFIPNYKYLLRSYAEKIQEAEDLVIFIEKQGKEIQRWKKAFWDMMYKKYLNIGASVYVEPEKVKAFTDWFNGQILLRIEIQSEENTIRVQRIYLDTLKKERVSIDRYIKELRERRDSSLRRLRVIKDNEEIQEAQDILETLDTPKVLKSPKLKLLQGGKGPPTTSGTNWLMELEEHTIFLCKRKGDLEFVAYQFTIDWKGDRGVLLSSNIPTRVELPVDSMGFSLTHELIEIQRKGFGSDN